MYDSIEVLPLICNRGGEDYNDWKPRIIKHIHVLALRVIIVFSLATKNTIGEWVDRSADRHSRWYTYLYVPLQYVYMRTDNDYKFESVAPPALSESQGEGGKTTWCWDGVLHVAVRGLSVFKRLRKKKGGVREAEKQKKKDKFSIHAHSAYSS